MPNQLRQEEHNALLHLFSTRGELLAYGGRNYHMHSADTSTLLLQLFRRFQQEIQAMGTPLEDFARETIDELLKELPAERILKAVPIDKRLEGVPIDKRLEGVPIDDLVKGLSPEMWRALREKIRETEASDKPE